MAGIAIERLKPPVVKDEQVDAGKALHARSDAAVSLGQRQVVDQPRQARVENRAVVAAGLVTDGAGEPALADAGRPDNRAVPVGGDPVALEPHLEQAAIEPDRREVINVFGPGLVPPPCLTQAKRKAPKGGGEGKRGS